MAKRKLSLRQKRRIAKLRSQKNSAFADASQHHPAPNELHAGTVVASYGSQVDVESAVDEIIYRCHVRANLDIVTGDRVGWRPESELGIIETREHRTSELQRPDIYGKLRTVAANVTQMVVTIAPTPEPAIGLIDRYLVAAKLHNLKVIILINKTDLLNEKNQSLIHDIEDRYSTLDYPVLKISTKQAQQKGRLEDYLNSETSIFVGQSGVGKSSLIQLLIPSTNIKVGELSEAEQKGRHTTTQATLYHLQSQGKLIDSPGIREFGLWHASADEVLNGFKEIAYFSQFCKFRNCSHTNEPNCAVREALGAGKIHSERFASFQAIISQLDQVAIKSD